MAGTSDRGSLMEDWMAMPPTPSPRTLMSSFLNEDFSSGQFSNFFGEHVSNKPHDQSEKRGELVDSRDQVPAQSATATPQKDFSLQPNSFNANQKSNPQVSLAERRASRAGFSIPKIDTSRVGSSTVIRSPIAIPPGLSPTTLLESPVFLYNSMAQPSPTTGKLFVASGANSAMQQDSAFNNDVFSFQPHSGPTSYSNVEKGYNVGHQSQSSNIHQQGSSLQSSFTAVKDSADETIVKPKTSDSMFSDNHSSEEQEDNEEGQNEEYSSATNSNPAEDGYNWRKYGQKQVKSSEHPRSYYKCTHPDCPVKKKVERSQDGQITEIVYKSSHNHPLPPPNRRSGIPSSQVNDPQAHILERPGSHAGLNTASLWQNGKSECIQDVQGVEGRPAACPPVSAYGDTSIMESQDAADVSSTLSNEIDRATQGTISLDCDGGEDETESKRRKLDALAAVTIPTATTTSSIDMVAAASRAVREPRVVVQTTSEVDILDDGYRWRKYGQKVVKGNPNPRSYYKCTHQGCSVRKHVERASHDLKSVITTYEGKHNHEVPAARNSGGAGSGSGSAPASAPQANLSHRRQEQAQGSYPQFGGATPFSSFGLPLRGHLGAAGNFHFGMGPPGMSMPPMPAARHPPSMMQGYPGLMMQEGQMKAEPDQQSGFASASASAYQQMMGRPPFGPQM